MTRLTRSVVTLLAVVIACVLPFGSAQADSNPDNVATATVEQDDGRAFDFAWDFDKLNSDAPVLHRNEAEAFARCMRCEATAIAFQIVLVHGSPRTVVPQNIAEAINTECTDCEVAAEARQFVRVSPEPIKVNREGRAVLADVRRDLAALAEQDLPLAQLHEAVEAQEARVREVLATDVVLSSEPDTEADFDARRTLQAVDIGG